VVYALALTSSCSLIIDVDAVRRARDAGGVPVLKADRASLDFGSATTGAPAAPGTVTLTNSGTAPLGALTAELTGAGASAFTLPDLSSCAGLAPGSACLAQIGFAPASARTWSATLTITANPGGSAVLLLSGTGVVPGILSITPALVDYGSVVQGGRSAGASFTISSTGTNATGALSVELTGVDALQFDLSTDGCTGQTLAPGATCQVFAGFAPGLAGPRRATLTVTGAPGGTAVAALTGTGVSGGFLAISPSTRQLPSVPAGAQGSPVLFQISNAGMTATGPITIGFSGSGAGDFEIVDTDCRGTALQPSTTCSLRARFAPRASGQKVATLLATADPGGNATASLSATALIPAALIAAPSSHDFGTVVTTRPASTMIVITNPGAVPTGVPTLALAGADASNFSLTSHDCNAALAPAGTCRATITFAPTRTGRLEAELVVSAMPGGSATVPFVGVAVAPGTLSASPQQVPFGMVLQGTTSAAQMIAITNTGGASTNGLSTAITGSNADQFSVTASDCLAPLASMASCNVSVAFAPTSNGSKSAALTVSEADGGTTVAQLLGTALAPPRLTITPMNNDFGGQVEGLMGQSFDFSVRNEGDVGTSAALQASLQGSGVAAFTITGNTCATGTLGAMQNCTVTVQFAPPVGALGVLQASLLVAPLSGPGGQVTAQLTGTGLTPSSASFDSMPFGAALIGQQVDRTFTLTNAGGGSTGVLTLSIGSGNFGDFQILAPVGPTECRSGTTSLAGGGSCTVRVRWTVGGRGNRSSQLTGSAASAGMTIAQLSGLGLQQATLSSTTSSANLGRSEVGVPSATTVSWVVNNSGDVTSGLGSLGLAGTNAADFQATGCAGALDAGASCTVQVRFTPSALGQRTAQVRLSANPGAIAPITLDVSGDGQGRLTLLREGGSDGGVVTSVPAGLTCGATCTGLFDSNQVVVLRASTTNGSNTFFRGWTQECAGPSRTCAVTINAPLKTARAAFEPIANNLVFVSSVPFANNLGSPAAYDARCNQLAGDAGINNATNDAWVSWVSAQASAAMTRLGSARGFVRVDGLPIVDQLSSLLAPQNQILQPISLDEFGQAHDVVVKTGTDPTGAPELPQDTCQGWTSSSASVGYRFGMSTGGPIFWSATNYVGCDQPSPVYCFMRTRTAAPTIPLSGGKRIWLTNAPFVAGSGQTPDQRCASNRPTGVTSAVALLGTSTRPAAALLDGGVGTVYVRPDGQVVGSLAELRSGLVRTGPWQSADGTYRPVNVWTGYGEPRTLEDAPPSSNVTCNNWTSGASTPYLGRVGESWRATARWFAAIDNNACNDTQIHLLCVEP